MKITFISLIEDVSIPGLRFLSAFIKKEGHQSEIIMLPRVYSEGLNDHVSFLYPYPNIVLEQLVEKCRESDLIGLSLMSCHFDNAVYITRYLKKHLSCPIIWGGIHPTIRPLECLEHADMVCVGEAELSLSMLMERISNKEDWKTISVQGILKQGEKLEQFLPGSILEDLKELPLPDYDLKDQFLLYKNNQIVRLDKNLLGHNLYISYVTTLSRGCPYACAYCCNNALNKVYARRMPIRHRPVQNIIEELEIAKKSIPGLREIVITDDAFFAQSQERIEEFSEEYKKKIDLPLKVLTTPVTFTLPKARALVKAGLCATAVGIQSASLRTRALYNRSDTLEQVLAIGDVVSQVAKETKKKIDVRYDFILDNPWENEEDLKDNIRFVLKLKRPFSLMLFSLTFYPETALYEKARQEGIIQDDLNQVYRKTQLDPIRSYFNALLILTGLGMPKFLVEFLLNTNIPKKHLISPLYFLVRLYTLKKELRSVMVKGFLRGDFQWVYTAFLIFIGRIKQKFVLAKHTELVRFKGKAGEI
ncbi:B12-binding domain-containing radical SAM protein [Patescibacteria group bacterium]|nr:B12-binding domain-containing radical SAM protein [Patescibacteria group bacterium]